MKIRCQCGAIYDVPETACGKQVHCKKCDTKFTCPTPPPKPPSFGTPKSGQNVPGTFVSSPYARKKRAHQPPSVQDQNEDAILKKYMSEDKSLEERMADRRQDSIEEDRTSNSIKSLLIGGLWLGVSVVVGIVLWSITGAPVRAAGVGRRRGVISGIIALLYYTGGKYWAPPLIALIGIYYIVIGILSFARVVDIEEQEQLPTQW